MDHQKIAVPKEQEQAAPVRRPSMSGTLCCASFSRECSCESLPQEEASAATKESTQLTLPRGAVKCSSNKRESSSESVPKEPSTPKIPRTPTSSSRSRLQAGDSTPSTACGSDTSPRSASSADSPTGSPSRGCPCTDSVPPTPKTLRVCRFCLESEEVVFEEDATVSAGNCTDEFVCPCPCRGSTKFVHLDCLAQFFQVKAQWHNFKCPTCRQPYEGRALRRLAEISRDRMLQDHGERSPHVAHSLCYLAQAHTQLGDVMKSKEVLELGLEISEAHYGAGHVATATILSELATAHGKLGDAQMQKSLLERSLEIKEAHFGVGHINTAVTLNNLATAYSELGDVQQEKQLLERSLEIKEKHHGKGHVQTTAALVNLAGVHGELGDAARGLELLRWALEIEERHYGEGHVETAITLNNLALAYGESRDVERMQELLVRCLAIKEQHFGAEHQELCLTLANLSIACAILMDTVSARRCAERAIRVCGDQPSGRRYGVVLLRVASVYAALGEDHVPEELAKRAACVLREALGERPSSRVLQLEGRRMRRVWSSEACPGVLALLDGLSEIAPVATASM